MMVLINVMVLILCARIGSFSERDIVLVWQAGLAQSLHRAIVQAALVLLTQQNKCIFRKVKERGNSGENLPCTCHRAALLLSLVPAGAGTLILRRLVV
jgi:hypothetical protein